MGFFFLSFVGLGTSLTGVGFGLGDLGAIGIAARAFLLITIGAAPLQAIAPPVLIVSPGLDIVLRIYH